MNNKINIIDYNISVNLLIYSILIYKLKNNKYENTNFSNLLNDLEKNTKFNHILDSKKNINYVIDQHKIYKNDNDIIIKSFYCDITHIYCIIIKNDVEKYLKIIFKGTSDNTHMHYNLKINQKNIKFLDNNNIKIHSGFYQQIFRGKLYQKIVIFLSNLNLKNYLIFYSGHSLGGVMATLFGYFTSYILHSNKIIITSFGCCRIGNLDFQKSFNNRENIICYRFCNNSDFVTKLPIINYEHVGIDIFLNKENKINIFDEHSYYSYLYYLLDSKW